MRRLASLFMSGLLFAQIATAQAATITVQLVDLDGKAIVSQNPAAVNTVQVIAVARDSNVQIVGAEVSVRVRSTVVLGSSSSPGSLVSVNFTPPTDPVSFMIVAQRFDEAEITAAVPFLVSAGTAGNETITITVRKTVPYRAQVPCEPTPCRRLLFRRRCGC